MEQKVLCAVECRLLGRCDWREWTGNWKWWQIHTLLNRGGPRRRVGHWLDIRELTDNEIDHTGWWPRHRIRPQGHRMGGGSGQVRGGGSRDGSRVELSGNDSRGHGGAGEVLDRTCKGEGWPGCKVHRRQGRAGGRMVSGSNEQRSQCYSKEDQHPHQIKEVVKPQHRREEKTGWKRQTQKTEFGGGRKSEGRAPEVDSEDEEQNAKWLLVEPLGRRRVDSSKIHWRLGGLDRGGINGWRREASKHSLGVWLDTETGIFHLEWRRSVLDATPSSKCTYTRHWGSSWASLIFSVSQKSTGPSQAIFWPYTATLEVGQSEDWEADRGCN